MIMIKGVQICFIIFSEINNIYWFIFQNNQIIYKTERGKLLITFYPVALLILKLNLIINSQLIESKR